MGTSILPHSLKKLKRMPKIDDTVFDELAEIWDEIISRTTHPIVKDFQKKERNFLDEVILDTSHNKIGLIEIGCGTGRLILQYMNMRIDPIGHRRLKDEELLGLQEKIGYIIGIDASAAMIERTIRNLRSYELTNRYMNDVFLIHMDAREIAEDLPKFLSKHNLQNFPRIFFCMLCTLGNISMPKRARILKAINEVMVPQDIFVASVWNRERFEDGIKMYQHFKRLIGDFREKNIFRETAEIVTETGYYSHWFYPKELKELVEKSGFRIEKMETPRDGRAGGFCVLIEAKKL
jgi:SAM-dependent methyltransferase